MKVCHRCRTPWSESGQPGFNNTCPGCGMSLHACANCRWFVASSRTVRCLKPDTPHVMDASAANRCAAFDFMQTDATVVAREAARAAQGYGATVAGAPAPSIRERWDRL